MAKPIIWSPLAEEDFANILQYLDNNWGSKVALHFVNLTDNFTRQIAIHPALFPLIDNQNSIRKCVITKHNSLYYREEKDQIQILRIYDTRQDPEKLRFVQINHLLILNLPLLYLSSATASCFCLLPLPSSFCFLFSVFCLPPSQPHP